MTKILLQNRKFLSLLLACFLFVWSGTIEAQTVSGVVRSADDDQPLNGVTVQIKGSTRATSTDANGHYSLSGVSPTDFLSFTFVGYRKETVPVNKRKQVDISLQVEASSLNQVVVIGYGQVARRDLTGSVGEVNMKDIVKAPVASFAEALAGRVAGVQVNSNDGQPGIGSNITIRGVGSLTQSTSPLYVVDGFPMEDFDLGTLSMDDIESISILKDASAAAIYGSRAANGVVIIETKKGKMGPPQISYSVSYGFQDVVKKEKMMNPYQFVQYQIERGNGDNYVDSSRNLEYYKDIKGTNMQDLLFNEGSTLIHNLSLRGAMKKQDIPFQVQYLDPMLSLSIRGISAIRGGYQLIRL